MRVLPSLLGLALLLSCSDEETRRRRRPEPSPQPACGDSQIEVEEECDGSNLGGASCESLGFDYGSLSCGSDCKFFTAGCVRRCGNGALDLGEECDGNLGQLACASWGYRRCGADCKVDSAHCVSQPFQPAPALEEGYGGPTILDDLTPAGMGDLIAASPARSGLKTYPYTVVQGFVAGRKLTGSGASALPISGDLNGDGRMDLAAINQDGSVDRFLHLADTDSFPVQPYPVSDGGAACPAFRWVGSGKLDQDGAADLLALGCPSSAPLRAGAFLLYRGGPTALPAQAIAQPGVLLAMLGDSNRDGLSDLLYVTDSAPQLEIRAAPELRLQPALALPFTPQQMAAGDLDGDRDLDLLAQEGAQLKALENTGTAFAERYLAVTPAPVGLTVADLDLDGLPDLAWVAGDRAQIRRNAGSFQFTPFEALLGAGAPLNLAVGDLDADGDPDLVATFSRGGEATISYVAVNKVR